MKIYALIFAVTLAPTLSARAESTTIVHCSNSSYQLSVVSSSGEGFMDALLTDPESHLLAQYQVHYGSIVDSFEGQNFYLSLSDDASSPTGRKGHFEATLAATGGSAWGDLVCDARKAPPQGLPPHCFGMQMPSYFNGSWHCLGGGH
jgi:hypothetical protein